MTTEAQLKGEYFSWMCLKVDDPLRRGYTSLLHKLHATAFKPFYERDENRYGDGIDLRYLFGYEKNYPDYVIANLIDNTSCSVLEMMIALAIKTEHTMENDYYGDRVHKWFWSMIDSLGFAKMTYDNYNEDYVHDILDKFMQNDYEPNGQGGLFYIPHCICDMRQLEIAYQRNRWINYYLAEKGE